MGHGDQEVAEGAGMSAMDSGRCSGETAANAMNAQEFWLTVSRHEGATDGILRFAEWVVNTIAGRRLEPTL